MILVLKDTFGFNIFSSKEEVLDEKYCFFVNEAIAQLMKEASFLEDSVIIQNAESFDAEDKTALALRENPYRFNHIACGLR